MTQVHCTPQWAGLSSSEVHVNQPPAEGYPEAASHNTGAEPHAWPVMCMVIHQQPPNTPRPLHMPGSSPHGGQPSSPQPSTLNPPPHTAIHFFHHLSIHDAASHSWGAPRNASLAPQGARCPASHNLPGTLEHSCQQTTTATCPPELQQPRQQGSGDHHHHQQQQQQCFSPLRGAACQCPAGTRDTTAPLPPPTFTVHTIEPDPDGPTRPELSALRFSHYHSNSKDGNAAGEASLRTSCPGKEGKGGCERQGPELHAGTATAAAAGRPSGVGSPGEEQQLGQPASSARCQLHVSPAGFALEAHMPGEPCSLPGGARLLPSRHTCQVSQAVLLEVPFFSPLAQSNVPPCRFMCTGLLAVKQK